MIRRTATRARRGRSPAVGASVGARDSVHKNTAQEAQEVDGGMRQKAGENPQFKEHQQRQRRSRGGDRIQADNRSRMELNLDR